jgi:hypothetical protein
VIETGLRTVSLQSDLEDQETRNRKTSGLLECLQALDLPSGKILTLSAFRNCQSPMILRHELHFLFSKAKIIKSNNLLYSDLDLHVE